MTDTPPDHPLADKVRRLPKEPGVYLWKDTAGTVLYVGKANDLRSRTRSYLAADRTAKTDALMAQAADVDYIAVRNQKEALVLEQTLIKRHKPRYNVRLTDGKQYPYIKLTNDRYPRLLKTHRYLDDGATYFGPFPDGYGAFHVMQALNDLFPLRRCKTLPDHKCLYYDIGKCIAPCIQACTDDAYAELVEEVKRLLSGRSDRIVKQLRERVDEAAAAHRFEEAARLRDQLAGLQGVLERQHMWQDRLEDRDVAAIAVRGDIAVVSILHQRSGKIVGQSPFVLSGVEGEAPAVALADFLRGHYVDRTVPRYVTLGGEEDGGERAGPPRQDDPATRQVEGPPQGDPATRQAQDPPQHNDATMTDVAPTLEADLRSLAGRAVTVEAPQRGDKRRWVEVARTNAALRLEEETVKRSRRAGAVEALQKALGLRSAPRVIEGFDVSHQAGAHTRAALVRFVDGDADKSGYRTFNMRDVGAAAVQAGTAVAAKGMGREVDDYASIHEAVLRRYRRLVEEDEALPDLVLIDGGRGQLEAARLALEAAGADVPVVSLAKREEEVCQPGRMHPVRLPRDHPGLQLLQRVRDEAHRFGITQVRRQAGRAVTASPLDAVKGIGPRRRQELVQAFGGLEGLRTASVEDLVKVRGVTRRVARDVVLALQPKEGA